MHLTRKFSALILLIIDIVLVMTVFGIACLVGALGKNVRAMPEVLEIREDGTAC